MMQPSEQTCDVLVIGGGPAGSAIGALLAEKGRKTIVLDKDRHPRFHIGESLLPLTLPYLRRLGVADQVEEIGLRKYAAEFHSMYHDNKRSEFRFGDAVDRSLPFAYEVRRAEFDHLLLKNCAAKGGEIREGYRVTDLAIDGDTIESVVARDEEGNEHRYRARFYVDATGRDTLMADRLGTKQRNPNHRSAAMYGHFSGARRGSGPAEGNISIYWFDHGWFWFIPLKGEACSVGAVCMPKYMKTRTQSVEEFFKATIDLCPPLRDRLASARLITPVTATGNYSYQSSRLFGKNYLLVGDAYAFVDPVFSGGVHLALNGAFRGAESIDRILDRPECAATELKRYRKDVVRGLKTFSWFIYRINTPALREMFINPRDILGVKSGVVSMLAGDLFRGTPIRFKLAVFRVIYYLFTLSMFRRSREAIRRRRLDMELS